MLSSKLAHQWLCCLALLALFLLNGRITSADEARPEDLTFFENEIRPLLAKHCYDCHSQVGDSKGRLLLDSKGSILRGGDSGPAATPGKPKESVIIDAVQYRGGLEMPPNGKLSADEISKLVRWVELGLPWPEEDVGNSPPMPHATFQIRDEQRAHWAFQAVVARAPPEVEDEAWAQSAIDRFIWSSLQSHELRPNGIADRATLLRRVTYDLTGLPPSPEELHHFLADQSAEAWPRVVDRLLASPHYGERWGRHWLDVVRYSDTAGDASDYPIPDAYKYRDYVIQSFNNDKPYDQFLVEQYAGDLLAAEGPPEKFAERTTATSLLALSRRFGYNDTTFYFFHLTLADLIDNMGVSVLGLSVGCARCHDHKFEPISAQDYYALYGIFSSTRFTYPGAEEIRHPKNLIPLVPPAEAKRLEAARQQQLAEFDQSIRETAIRMAEADGGFEQQTIGKPVQTPWKADTKVAVADSAQSPFQNMFATGKLGLRLPNSAENIGFSRPISMRNTETPEQLHINVDFRNVRSETPGNGESEGSGRYRICVCRGKNFLPAAEVLIDGSGIFVNNGGVVGELTKVNQGTWYNLQLSIDTVAKTFSGKVTDGQTTWSFKDQRFHPQSDGTIDMLLIDAHGDDKAARPVREIDNVTVRTEPFPPATPDNLAAESDAVGEWTLARDSMTKLNGERTALARTPVYPTVAAVTEGTPADAPLQHRGEPNRLGEKIPRRFLEILGGEKLPADCKESGRRELASWLVSPNNPLTARVIANRVWHYHFGRGIVATPNDFGVRGDPPTHPELLDFLANQLIRGGWSLKSLHREILLSRTYQLSSESTSASRQMDPANQWLSRFSSRRLDAESIRDSLLLISGELDLTPSGPHPFPPVETWRFSQHNPFKAVYDTRKRSVYLMTQRIARHPYLALFDGADTNTTTGQRLNTTTPLQALYLMNDPFVHERSMATAKKLIAELPAISERLRRLSEWAWCRSLSDAEQQEAEQFVSLYSSQLPDNSDREVSAWAAYVRAVLSSNQFLYVD